MNNRSKYLIIALISIFLLGASFAVIEFESIKLRKNPAIILPKGDTVVNDTAGVIKFPGANIVASHFITQGTSVSSGVYYVAPDFSNDTIKHTASSISFALTKLQSGMVFVYDGTYEESITAKSNVSIAGTGAGKVIISSGSITTVNINGISNFLLKDLTVGNNASSETRYCIEIKNCNPGSTESPAVTFENIEVFRHIDTTLTFSAIHCDNSSFTMTGSYVHADAASGVTAGGLVRLVFITNGSFPIFNSCKFKANLFIGDISLCYGDLSSEILASHSQNESNTSGYFISYIDQVGNQIYGRSYNNVSNVENSPDFNNYFTTNNNIVESTFIVR